MPTPKSQNPSRVRDNQRRSRARRKEYLSELESKLSHCQRVGAQASVEIQIAARRVLEENRQLRERLGLSDDSRAAEALESLLGEGRWECGDSNGGGGAADVQAQDESPARRRQVTTNCSSCRTVSDAIRTMRPDVGVELERELGCEDGAGDCSVPNVQAFDVMDRYG